MWPIDCNYALLELSETIDSPKKVFTGCPSHNVNKLRIIYLPGRESRWKVIVSD